MEEGPRESRGPSMLLEAPVGSGGVRRVATSRLPAAVGVYILPFIVVAGNVIMPIAIVAGWVPDFVR